MAEDKEMGLMTAFFAGMLVAPGVWGAFILVFCSDGNLRLRDYLIAIAEVLGCAVTVGMIVLIVKLINCFGA